MEKGINVASKSVKGSRSFIRLNTLRAKLNFVSNKFRELYGLDKITDISEDQLVGFFSDMKNGVIKRLDGGEYLSVDTYSKAFKAFWHWHQKVSKKRGIEVTDITVDLDTKQEKPKWVYLTDDQMKKLCDNAKYEYKVLFMFLFDTGIRAPTELVNIKVSDLFNDCKEVNIREEISKTFGRRIKLMLSSDLLKTHIKDLKLDDYVFPINHNVTNQYIKRLSTKLFGDEVSPAGEKYSKLTMYDFRHISCCYWLPRYKSESALKYRFGWKKSDKIHYYSELLGMKDTIAEEDLLLDVTKTEIEKRLTKSENEKE
ncbi:MAG: tyrosine-type recombinase/integrase, partial [archaeon]|nr:tyrosine-type recombinase/integrase [archaeon]